MSRSAEPSRAKGAAAAAPFILAALIGGSLVFAGGAGAAQSRHDRLPCGILPLLDDLLHCPRPEAPPPPGPQADGPPPAAQPPPGPEPLRERAPRTTSEAPQFVPDRLLVRFRNGVSRSSEDAALARAEADAVDRIDPLNVVVAHVDPARRDAALDQLAREDAVATVEKDAVLEAVSATPNDADWSAQWGLRRVGFPSAWDGSSGVGAIVVAVLDTGVDATQRDLRGSVLPALGPSGDDNGHGTAVAGIIAARTGNGEGIAGVCAVCSILPVKVLGADGKGDTALVAAGVVRSVDAGARVISMSLGGPADDQTLEQAVAYATSKDVVVVAAAGNQGLSAPFYPAASPGVVGVAGTDENDHLYSWSNYGSWVQLAAPGCNAAPALDGSYELFCGTSSATPLVAGLIALRLAEHPEGGSAGAIDALERTATPIGSTVRFGRVDAVAAFGVTTAAPAARPAAPQAVEPLRLFTVKGLLTPRIWSRVYRSSTKAALVTASLTFSGTGTLELSFRTRTGAVIGRTSGRSPLRLSERLPAGALVVAVSGRRTRTHFELLVTSAQPAGKAGQ